MKCLSERPVKDLKWQTGRQQCLPVFIYMTYREKYYKAAEALDRFNEEYNAMPDGEEKQNLHINQF